RRWGCRLAFGWRRGCWRSVTHRNANEGTGLDAKCLGVARTDQRRIIPGQLRDRIGDFLQPRVVYVAAVVDRIIAHQPALGRFRGRRRGWPAPEVVGNSTGSIAVERGRLVA